MVPGCRLGRLPLRWLKSVNFPFFPFECFEGLLCGQAQVHLWDTQYWDEANLFVVIGDQSAVHWCIAIFMFQNIEL